MVFIEQDLIVFRVSSWRNFSSFKLKERRGSGIEGLICWQGYELEMSCLTRGAKSHRRTVTGAWTSVGTDCDLWTQYVLHAVSQGCLREGDKYTIYVCPGQQYVMCACHNLPRIASATLSSARHAVVHCCVPTAYYRMARTIRFYSRSLRYFRRASPIFPRSIRSAATTKRIYAFAPVIFDVDVWR